MNNQVKIFGERNTGTNYLAKLIRSNLNVNIIRGTVPRKSLFMLNEFTKDLFFFFTKKYNLGWKHSYIDLNKISRLLSIVTLTKNPYSFLLSLYKNPYHYIGDKPKTFEGFINNHWIVRKRDNLSNNVLKNPIELWNIKNKSYMDLYFKKEDICLNLKYEDLVADPRKIIMRIASKFSLDLNQDFLNYQESTKNSKQRFEDYQRYYMNEEWKVKLHSKHINLINKYLDEEVMSFFQYQKL